jgi:hypothetical protein
MKRVNDWIDRIDWTKTDKEIARKTQFTRHWVGELRIEQTGISNTGVRFDPPFGFSPEPTVKGTSVKYQVSRPVATWWHKVHGVPKASVGRPRKPIPDRFSPVWRDPEINYAATALKYGVSYGTVQVWLRQLNSAQA